MTDDALRMHMTQSQIDALDLEDERERAIAYLRERLRVLTQAARAAFDAVTDECDPSKMSDRVWQSLDALRGVLDDRPHAGDEFEIETHGTITAPRRTFVEEAGESV